jgi:hypothetical protein
MGLAKLDENVPDSSFGDQGTRQLLSRHEMRAFRRKPRSFGEHVVNFRR